MTTSRLRTLAAATAGVAALLAGFAPAAPAVASGPVPAGVRSGLGQPDPPHRKAWWYDALRLSHAHRITTGRGVTVAIVGEEGFALGVPELEGADVHLEKDCLGAPARSESPSVITNHGTGMAAFIAGTGRGPADSAGLGTLGVAPGARVELWPTGPGATCSAAEKQRQVLAAARSGADIISLSDRIDGDWTSTVREIHRLGAVLVVGAGNRDQTGPYLMSPADTRGVVAVTAVDKRARAWEGNATVTQSQLDAGSGYPAVAAPGVDDEISNWFKGYGWSTGTATGTSDSTALVSGLLALVKSRYPDATGNQLVQQLIHDTGGAPEQLRWDPRYGFGIASATEMLKHDPTQWPDENPLLLTPAEVVSTYPMSVRGRKHVLETAAASPRAAPSAGSAPDRARSAAGSTSGGVPVVVWAALVVALLVLGAVLAARRRSGAAATGPDTSTESDRQKQGV